MRSPFPTVQVLVVAWKRAWSSGTSYKWTPENPAMGQCSVTCLVVQDLFGGQIVTTQVPGGTHFYNRIDGQRIDLTVSQFQQSITFDDHPASRAEALRDAGLEQYFLLRQRLGPNR
ncbi:MULTISPECIES: YunG family protein [Alphaproteobacteria]|nr:MULTISPECIES: hypothetical protein [Alphaproteobacteria]